MDNQPKTYYNAQLSDKEFDSLSSYIYGEYGIKMPYVKKLCCKVVCRSDSEN